MPAGVPQDEWVGTTVSRRGTLSRVRKAACISGAASLVLTLAVAPTAPAFAAAAPGAPVHDRADRGARLGYASAGVEQLAAGTAATRVLPPTDTTITRDSDAFARGAAVTWVSHKQATGSPTSTPKPDGDIAYWGGGAAPTVSLTGDAFDDRHPVLNAAGTQVAFTSNRSGNWDIWTIGVDGTGLRQLTTSRATDDYPSYNPDGTQLAFMSTRDDAAGDIYTVPTAGGTVKKLVGTPNVIDTEPAWSPSGSKVAFTTGRYRTGTNDNVADVAIVPAPGLGSTVIRVTTSAADGEQPAWSPDSTKIAIRSRTADPSGDIYTVNPSANSARTAVAVTSKPESRPSWWTFNSVTQVIYSTLISKDNGDIWTSGWGGYVAPADGDRTNVSNTIGGDEADPEFSPDGSKVAYVNWDNANGRSNVVLANADGSSPRNLTTLVENRTDTQPSWSPDGTLLAVTRGGPGAGFGSNHPQQIVIIDAVTGDVRATIGDPSSGRPATFLTDNSPTWSADGSQIAFGRVGGPSSTNLTYRRIWIADVDHVDTTVTVTGQHRLITNDSHTNCTVSNGVVGDTEPAFQQNGGNNYVAFAIGNGQGICRTNADGTDLRKMNSPTAAGTISDLAWSPDGYALAFVFTPTPPPVVNSAPNNQGTTPKTTPNPNPKTTPKATPSPTVPAGGHNGSVGLGVPGATSNSAYTAVPALHRGGTTLNNTTAQIWTVYAGTPVPGDPAIKSIDVPGGAVSPTFLRTGGYPTVSVTAGPQPATVGSDITATYAVKNNSDVAVKSLWVKITAPAGLQVKSVTPTQCASDGTDCFVPTLAANATFTATITYTVTAPLNGSVSASAQMGYPDGTDGAANSATVLATSGSLNYRIAYASNDVSQLFNSAPGSGTRTSALPGTNGQFAFDPNARGTALTWIGRGAPLGSAETDGELYYAANAAATPVKLTNDLNNIRHPALSPDGTQIAFADDRSGSFNIWVINVDGTGIRRITTSPSIDDYPTWSPNGQTIAFSSNRSTNGDVHVYSTPAAGGATTQLTTPALTNNAKLNTQPTWSPDGTRIAYTTTQFRGGGALGLTDVAVILATGIGTPARLTTAMDSSEPAWSPDSLSVTFTSTRNDGAGDIYTQPLGATTPPQAVATRPNTAESHPTWWTPAGGGDAQVLYTALANTGNGADIWSSELTGSGRADHSDRPIRDEGEPAFTANGSKLASVEYDERGDSRIAVSEFDGKNNRPVTDFGDAMISDSNPTWAPNGQVLAFTRTQYQSGEDGRIPVDSWIVIVRVDATSVTTLLSRLAPPEGQEGQDSQPTWARTDASQIAFTRTAPDGDGNQATSIWRATVTIAGDTATVSNQRSVTTDGLGVCRGGGDVTNYSPAFDPTSLAIAYVSHSNNDGSDTEQLCVVFPNGSGSYKALLSSPVRADDRIDNPAWSPDSAYIAYDYTYTPINSLSAGPAAADVSTNTAIFLVNADGGQGAQVLTTPGGAQQPAFQPRFVRGIDDRPPLDPNDATNRPFSLDIAPQPGVVGGSPLVATYTIRNLSTTPKTAAVITTGLPSQLPVVGNAVIGGSTDPTASCTADGKTCNIGIINPNSVITVKLSLSPAVKIATTVSAKLDYVDASGAKQTLPASSPLVVGEPTITLTPTVGPPGLVPTAKGAGFPPKTKVTLAWQFGVGQRPIDVTTDAKGNFSVPLVVPYNDIKNKRMAGAALTGTGTGFKPVKSPTYMVGGVPNFPGPNQ